MVAIVGGGAAGALTALSLLKTASPPVRVVIIEPRNELGRGVAYSTTDLAHVLNVRAHSLSALADEPGHFTAWARRHTDAEGASFLPRAWYGDYLGSLVASIEHLRARAVRVVPCGGRVQIILAGGKHCQADRVVLAPGASPSAWPGDLVRIGSLRDRVHRAERRWVEDPWDLEAVRAVPLDQPVLLIGTGLTAVDIALSLHGAGHRQIIATSRHGLLPAAHADQPDPPLSLKPPSHLAARSLLAWAQVTAAEVGDWGPVVSALRPHTDDLWCGMATAEQARLLRHVYRRWEVVRHRMAPAVAARIAVMRDAGALTVESGGIRSARAVPGGIGVELPDRTVRVGAVINCTGPTADVRRTRHPLIRRLLEEGVARPGPLHLGLDTDARGCLPGTAGALWLIGPLRRGRSWETTAIPEIRDQAAALSPALWPVTAAVGA